MNIRTTIVSVVASAWMLIAPLSLHPLGAANLNEVFSWKEVPQGQEVPIRRALFDRGGYQLYDTSGETIAIPFARRSLCSLKFHRSHTGGMYFVNRGYAPVLYVPGDGCLENANVPNAYWYPFSHNYDPSEPVYMSAAPSYDTYNSMSWYPGMRCYGGYHSARYIDSGTAFIIAIGLFYLIDGHHYDGWHPYYSYCRHHHSDYPMAYYNPQVYGWANRSSRGRSFIGTHHNMALRSLQGGSYQRTRVFRGTGAAVHARNVQNRTHDSAIRSNGIAMHKIHGAVTHSTNRVFNRAASHSLSHAFHGAPRIASHGASHGYRTTTHSAGRTVSRTVHTFRRDTRSSGNGGYHAVNSGGNHQSFGGNQARSARNGNPQGGGGSHQGGGSNHQGGGSNHQGGGGNHQGGGGNHQGGGGNHQGGGGNHQGGGGNHQGGGGNHKH